MLIKIEFKNEQDKLDILEIHKDKYILEIHHNVDSSGIITVSDFPTTEILQQEQAHKISILESQQANTEYVLMMGGLI